MQKEKDLMVAVWMVTYNHENYIAQAINGVISQKSNFKFKLFIGEDCSCDNTKNVCLQFVEKHSDIIQLISTNTNDIKQNSKNIYDACYGSGAKYVAMCEGDDYWTDENKLQKQVDFLEGNPDYAICFHEAKKLFEDGSEILYSNFQNNRTFHFYDFTQANFISTASCVFRVYDHLHPLPDWFYKISAGDWGLHLLNASKGKVFFMDDCMSVYRIHNGGMWASLSSEEAYKKEIEIMDQLNSAFNYEYDTYFEEGKAKRLASYKGQLLIPPPIQKEPFRKRVKKQLIKYFR